MIRQTIAALALMTVSVSAFAQVSETKSSPAAPNNSANQPPPFAASLLLIKADWTQSPMAKEIDAEMRQAWGEDHSKGKLLDKSPNAGPRLQFSTGAASIYTEQHYAQLLAWLKARQLFQQIEPFKHIPSSPSGETFTAYLDKDTSFFGVPARRNQEDPFFTSISKFAWTIEAWTTQWNIERELRHFELGRGQDTPQLANTNEYDRCNFYVEPLQEGQVSIVHAFPATEDAEYLNAAKSQGLQALIVFEKRLSPATDSAEPRLLLPDKVERMRGSSSGGSPQRWPQSKRAQASAATPARYIIAKDVMISWSEPLDTAWGFSKSLGKWAEQKLDPPATAPPPRLVSDDLFVWRVGSTYYAFSSEKAQWDVLRLPEGHTPHQALDNGFARVHDGDNVFTFAAATGQWSSPTGTTTRLPATPDPELEAKKREVAGQYSAAQENLTAITQQLAAANSSLTTEERRRLEAEEAKLRPQIKSYGELLKVIDDRIAQASHTPAAGAGSAGSEVVEGAKPDETQIKVFSLHNIRARDAERVITQLFAREVHSIAADERTNSLIVRGPAAELNIIYAIITRLDELDESASASQSTTTTRWPSASTVASVAELAKQSEAKEQQAADLAHQTRELQSASNPDKEKLDRLSSNLRRAVADAFAVRQQLHQAEVIQLQERIGGIERNLKARASLSQEIIERRVKDLLNPDLQWDATSRRPAGSSPESAGLPPSGGKSSATTTSTSRDAKTATSDSGLAQPNNVSLGTSAYTVIQNVLGVDVEFVVGSTVSSAGFRGGFHVTKAHPSQPGLQAGDIIVGLNGWETLSDTSLAWAALQPADKKIIFQMPKARQTVETVPAHIVRDGKYQITKVELRPWAPQSQRSPASLPPASASSNTIDNLTSAEAEKIWNMLGVKVRPWAPKNEDPFSPKSRYTGGAEITEVRPDGPADGPSPLRNGDIIVQLGEWEVFSPQRLVVILSQPRNHGELMKVEDRVMQRVDIQVLRGNDKVSKTIVIPLEAATATVQPSVDLTAARAYRDVLRERVELLKRGYQAGEMTYLEYLRAAIQLDDAEIAAAASPEDRKKVRQAKVEHLQQSLEIARRLHSAGELPQADLLAAQAEFLKAEAELAAESAGESATATATRPGATSTVVLGTAGQTTTLRSPDEFRRRLAELEPLVSRINATPAARYNGKTDEEKTKTRSELLDRAERDLAFLREEYMAQIRLLQLECQDADSAVQSAIKALSLPGGPSARLDRERAIESAQRRAKQALTVLELYRKADPKHAPAVSPEKASSTEPVKE